MYLKNLQSIFIFVTFALLTLSSPINDDNSIELIEASEEKKLITEGLSISEFN
eukprot:jgi/Orpsp1_1/1192967/evm.model.d7180000097290.1